MRKTSVIISNVLWKFAERILAQLVSLLVSIVLARLLLPDDYGAISMVTVFITIANVFVTSGIPNALIQKKNADKLDFSSVFYFNFVFSIIIYVILFFSAPTIAYFYDNQILCPVIRVMGLRVIIASVNSVQHSYVSRHMMFKKYFWSTFFGTALSGIVGVAMAYMGFGVWALVAQYMTNTIVDTIVLFITVDWKPTLEFSMKRILIMLNFGWKILFEGLSSEAAAQVRNLVIGKVYTAGDLAFYTKGQQFPALIVNNISTSISSVLFPAISSEQDDKAAVLLLLRKSIRVSSYVVYPMLMGLAVIAQPFISILLTDKWIEAVPYMQVFCILNAPTVGMIPRHQALNGIGRSDIFMNEHIVGRIVSLILLACVYRISILAIVLSSIASTCILTVIIAYTSKKYNGYTYKDQLKDIMPSLMGCFIMGIFVYFILYLGMPNIVTLCLQIILGIAIYIFYSALLKLEEFKLIKNYLRLIFDKKKARKD